MVATASSRFAAPALAAICAVVAAVATAADPADGRRTYLAACASCHAPDGRGQSVARVGFDLALPDFTDCDFATREPDADWLAVSHQGGPARGFSELMPAFGEALTDAEVQAALDHIRTMCIDPAWPRGELNLPRPLFTEKAYPEDEAVLTLIRAGEGPDTVEAELVWEQRFGARNQFELVLPMVWDERVVDPMTGETDRGSSVGDVAVGVKRAFWHDLARGSILSGTAEMKLPTGDENAGHGAGTAIFEPFVTFGQILPADAFLQTQAGLELPLDPDEADEEAFLRIAAGRTITRGRWGRAWTPMVELLGARELVSGADTSWDIVPQVQITLNRRQHVMLDVGVRTPLDDRDTRRTEVVVYLLWDWFDGGLFEGW